MLATKLWNDSESSNEKVLVCHRMLLLSSWSRQKTARIEKLLLNVRRPARSSVTDKFLPTIAHQTVLVAIFACWDVVWVLGLHPSIEILPTRQRLALRSGDILDDEEEQVLGRRFWGIMTLRSLQ